MKERYLWIGLFIVLCSMLGNYLFFQSKQLKQPIFLDHYYDFYIQDGSNASQQLTFYYLSNRADPVEIRQVSVDGIRLQPINIPGFFMWPNKTYTPYFERAFAHHYLQSVTVELPIDEIPLKAGTDDVWSFEEMEVTFSNGQTIDATIGKVQVYGEWPNNNILEFKGGSSSSSYSSETHFTVSKPLTIEEITFPFAEDVAEDLYIKMDLDRKNVSQDDLKEFGNVPVWYNNNNRKWWDEKDGVSLSEDLFPIQLHQSDLINFYNHFNPDAQIAFNFYMTISGFTDEGEPFEYRVPINAMHSPHLTQQAVNEIITEKQGGQIK